MRPRKVWQRIERGSLDVRFDDALSLAKAFGFELDRIRGSHHILVHLDLRIILNLQPEGRRAKRYQIRRLVAVVREHGLTPDD